MAKIIRLSPDCFDDIRAAFEEVLRSAKLSDGKINFTKSFGNIQRKATVYFTEKAWLKMQALVSNFDKEVAWHGTAYRGDDPEKDEYYIGDILVYPQEVTGSTVTTDQVKYQSWLMEHDDDIFNNIRMQGHSHVNMGTTPSSVDTSLYDRILDQLDDTMFYIFMIYNKRGEKTYKIYDLAKNVLFETADVDVKIIDGEIGLSKFMADAKDKVTTKTYSSGSGYNGNYGGGYGGGYGYSKEFGGGYSGNYGDYGSTPPKPSTPPAKQEDKKEPEKLPPAPAPASAKKDIPQDDDVTKKKGHRKGKRRGKKTPVDLPTGKHHYDYDEDDYPGYDDADDPYGSYRYH